MSTKPFSALPTLVLLLVIGCGGSTSTDESGGGPSDGTATNGGETPDQDSANSSGTGGRTDEDSGGPALVPLEKPISVSVKSWDDIEAFVERRRGSVVVVDLWSTWCEPCLRELPHLVDLDEAHGSELVCATVSLDYAGLEGQSPESLEQPVLAVLEKLGATTTNFLCSVPDEKLYGQLELGSIPAVLVYGRDGKLAKRFDNDAGTYGNEGFNYEDHVTPFVEGLLSGDASTP